MWFVSIRERIGEGGKGIGNISIGSGVNSEATYVACLEKCFI